MADGEFVFPGAKDRRKAMAWRSAFVARLVERTQSLHEGAVPRWTVHNLRHTMRTHMREELGVRDDVAAAGLPCARSYATKVGKASSASSMLARSWFAGEGSSSA